MPVATMPKLNLSTGDVSYHTAVTAAPDDSVTRCICEFQHDDGYMIQCDKCGVWQHVDCMEVDRDNIPDSYMCELCEPRKVDKHKAIQIQTNKRDALSLLRVDSSATETEDETTDGRRHGLDKSPLKKEPKEFGCGSTVGSLALNKKRKTKSKRDDRLKQKLDIKRQTNGPRKLSISSPKKAHFEAMAIDGFGETVRQDAALPQNGALVMPASSLDSNPATVEIFQEAVSNLYTVELQNLLASIKFNGQQGLACSPSVYERLQFGPPSCRPAAINSSRMCLEATEDSLVNQPLIEYIGKVMLRDQYDRDGLFYFRSQPNVLFHSKLGGLDLCIDASLYGNTARYVRRSCTPNAEVRHLLEGSTVRFFLCATKCIARGAEITIPFDFNYHKCCYAVDCACTRISCPVAKFQRREVSHAFCPTARRQRSTRSLDVASANQENAMLSPRRLPVSSPFPSPLSPSVLGAVKHSKMMRSLGSFKLEPEAEIEIAKTEIKIEPDPVKLEPVSPTWQLPSIPTTPVVTQETSFPVSSASSVLTSSSSAVNAGDADENDKSKKKTREEKKLEAVMKMFERLEKQQERKKEALSRHEQGRGGKEVTKTRESRKSKDKPENKNIVETNFDAKELPAEFAFNFNEQVMTTLPETTPRVEPKPRMRRVKHTTTSRRASMSAAAHPVASVIHPPVTLLGSSDGVRSAVLELPTTSAVADSTVSSTYLSNPSALETATSLLALSAERWIGYPKKLMMKGQDLHKQLTIRTDGLDSYSNSEGDSGKEFVQCVPSPHSRSLNALRRNSMPAFNSSSGAAGVSSNRAALFAASSAVNGTDSKGCSAKKRWLQQAMCDKSDLQPIGEEAFSGNSQIPNNCNSPTDFVTPLKKRRLARESLSTESPPSVVQPEDIASTSSMFPLYESISDDDHMDFEMTPSSTIEAAKPERFDVWDSSLIANHADIIGSQKTEKLVPGSGLLRTHVPVSVNARPAMVLPEGFLLMPVGYQCPAGVNRSVGNTISNSGGFGAGTGVELGSVQAWQKTIPDFVTSGVGSGLLVANPYHTTGYLSNLDPGGEKLDSLDATEFVDYRRAFDNIESARSGSRNGSGNQMPPLTAGLKSGAGTADSVYLAEQTSDPTLNSEMSPGSSGGFSMSLFRVANTQSCAAQGIMALAEAACRRGETATETKTQTGEPASPRARNGENVGEISSNLSLDFPLTNSDRHAGHQSGVTATQTSFIGGVQNPELNHMLSAYLPVNNTSVVHSVARENGTSLIMHWSRSSVCNGSNGAGGGCDATGCTIDIPVANTSAVAPLSSPTSTAGHCTSKKKVSLHEYKMRRKSGSTGQGHLSSGSDTSLSLSFDAISPFNRSTSNTFSPDGSRELVEGLSLAWSSDATEAEKALENLTSSEKLFKIDKVSITDISSSSPSRLLHNVNFHPSGSVPVHPAPVASVSASGALLGNSVSQLRESRSAEPHLGVPGGARGPDHSVVVGAGVAPESAATTALSAQTSGFGGESGAGSLIER